MRFGDADAKDDEDMSIRRAGPAGAHPTSSSSPSTWMNARAMAVYEAAGSVG